MKFNLEMIELVYMPDDFQIRTFSHFATLCRFDFSSSTLCSACSFLPCLFSSYDSGFDWLVFSFMILSWMPLASEMLFRMLPVSSLSFHHVICLVKPYFTAFVLALKYTGIQDRC